MVHLNTRKFKTVSQVLKSCAQSAKCLDLMHIIFLSSFKCDQISTIIIFRKAENKRDPMESVRLHFLLLVIISYVVLVGGQQIRNINGNIKNKQFAGFELYNDISTTLVENEVIRVAGVITDKQFYVGNESVTFLLQVNFTLKNDSNVNFTCRDVYPLENLEFDISCTIKKAGEFNVSLSATPAQISEQKLFNYTKKYTNTSSVVRRIKPFSNFAVPSSASKDPPKPEGFEFNFVENNLELKWTSKAPLTNVTFYQISSKTKQLVKKEFLLSGNHQIFYPDFFEFRYFYPGNTTVEISHANSEDGTLNKISSPYSKEKASVSFNAIRHIKQANSQVQYTVTPALPNVLKVAERYNFTITFKVKAKTIYFMTSIDYNTMRRTKFYRPKPEQEDEVKENVPVNVQVVFDKPGAYLMTFQAADRRTILNHPIYVGGGTPFLPDYFDYYEYLDENYFDQMLEIEEEYIARYLTDGKIYKDPGFDAPIEQQRALLFELLNYQRRKYRASPLVMDETLQRMAQEHSQDQLDNNYLGVKNLKGEMPLNRAMRYNLTSIIREYILGSFSLGGMHLDTQISGSFIEITANKMLSRVGIGIVVNQTHIPRHYIVTYDFTIRDLTLNPPDPVELEKFRQEIIKVMIEKNPNVRAENKDLSADINTWIKQNTVFNSEDLESFLDKKWSSKKKVKVWSREVFYYEDELLNIRDDDKFDNKEGTEIGLGLVINKESKSTMSAFVVFI